jgi:polar amino acid transport system substrate-binding protein
LLAGVGAVTVAGATLGTTTACSRISVAAEGKGGDLLERLRARGTVRLGIGGEPPLNYIDKRGELTGSDPSIARTIFQRLGVPHVEPRPMEFNSLIPGLTSRQFDVIAAGMYITPERCEQVLFADPHYQMKDQFIVAQGNPERLHDYRDVYEKKVKLATVAGYAEIGFANKAGIRTEDMHLVHDPLSGLLAVKQGRVHVFSTTTATIRYVFRQASSDEVDFTEPFNPLGHTSKLPGGAFAFRKGESRLRDAFNHELLKMKKSGELLRLMRPHGFREGENTSQTAEELCE